jgi:hypothetical protein
MLLGLAATAAGCLLALAPDPQWKASRFPALFLGLLTTGTAVWMRCASTQPSFVEGWLDARRPLVLAAVAGLGAIMVVAPTVLLILYVAGEPELPWRLSSLVLMWLLAAPWGSWLAWRFTGRLCGGPVISRSEESAALLTLAALVALGSCWAVNLGTEQAGDWDSILAALAVLTLVALVAAPLMIVSRAIRRIVISMLVLLHFGGILTAVLSAPPTPWLVGQIWARFYRPYLEFMYLNNAYHFYAPEPGPAASLWFRIESEDRQHKIHSHWLKIPDMDDNTGQPRYALALEYQRMMALTENTTGQDPAPPLIVTEGNGAQHYHPYFFERFTHAPGEPAALGAARPERGLLIPFHPQLPVLSQCRLPDLAAKRFVESFARFIMHKAAAADPERTPLRVKVYRVVHTIPEAEKIASGMDPCYPLLYLPYYMGEFDADGKMTKAGMEDPFLYWVIPILKKEEKPDSEISLYVFQHAGEPGWKLDATGTGLKTKLKLPEDT